MKEKLKEIKELSRELNEENINKILDILFNLLNTEIVAYEEKKKMIVELGMNGDKYKVFENEYICNNLNEEDSDIIFVPYIKALKEEEIMQKRNIDLEKVYVYIENKILYIYTKENILDIEDDVIRYMYSEYDELQNVDGVMFLAKKMPQMQNAKEFKKNIKSSKLSEFYDKASILKLKKGNFRDEIENKIVYNISYAHDFLYESDIQKRYNNFKFISIKFVNLKENPRIDREKFEKVFFDEKSMKKIGYGAGLYGNEFGDYIIYTKELMEMIVKYKSDKKMVIYNIVTGEEM